MTKNDERLNSPEQGNPDDRGAMHGAASPAGHGTIRRRDYVSKLSKWLFSPHKRVLIKVVPHSSEAVYKLEVSHLHLALVCISVLILSAVFFISHIADVRAAEARVRTLQTVEARQRRELQAFTKQTNMLWQRVGKLQRDDEEMHRLTKVILPKAVARPMPHRAVAGTKHAQFGAAMPMPTLWKRTALWLRSLASLEGIGFAAEASDLSSLTDAVDVTDQQTSALASRIRSVAYAKIAARLARERYLAAIPSIWPTLGYISSGFGFRAYPDYRFHLGLDIVNDYGAAVFATAAGIVVEAGWDGGYGYKIVIDHGNGLQTMYGHNSRLMVSPGETVKKGQQIATVGATGFATGPHVHYQVELWGKPIDPTPYLSGGVKVVALSR